MRRGLVHVLAWLLATAAAVTLSWWGVHTVMAGTAYDPPRALPITAAEATTQESRPLASPTPTRTERATPSKSPSPAPRTTTAKPSPSSKSPSPTASGQVRSYDTDGGRAVFDLGANSATLVSATPGTGWSMQVWKTESWIRVEFSSGADRVSVFCTWHDGPPRVEIGTY
jgi:cytoskeletal protein RodZ